MLEPAVAELARSLKSLWALELLMHLHRHAGRAWPAADLVRELRSSRSLIDGILLGFAQRGLAERLPDGSWRYGPAPAPLDGQVARLAAAYAERPLAVASEIARAPNEKLRSFSDAFRIERE